jgi:hypothetical protein
MVLMEPILGHLNNCRFRYLVYCSNILALTESTSRKFQYSHLKGLKNFTPKPKNRLESSGQKIV